MRLVFHNPERDMVKDLPENTVSCCLNLERVSRHRRSCKALSATLGLKQKLQSSRDGRRHKPCQTQEQQGSPREETPGTCRPDSPMA